LLPDPTQPVVQVPLRWMRSRPSRAGLGYGVSARAEVVTSIAMTAMILVMMFSIDEWYGQRTEGE
jgi:hypothetical protein